jgi:hypothetical protein
VADVTFAEVGGVPGLGRAVFAQLDEADPAAAARFLQELRAAAEAADGDDLALVEGIEARATASLVAAEPHAAAWGAAGHELRDRSRLGWTIAPADVVAQVDRAESFLSADAGRSADGGPAEGSGDPGSQAA